MKTVAVLATVFLLVSAQATQAAGKGRRGKAGHGGGGDGEANAAVAKAHAAHVWVRGDAFPEAQGARLSAWLGQHPPKAEIKRKAADGPWPITYLAVFKKPAVKGAMTVQFVEKGDANGFVDQYSPDNGSAAYVFRGNYDLSPDQGFNKGHTYTIKVGQLLNGKFVLYASGEVALK
jgi:hypothetical protein